MFSPDDQNVGTLPQDEKRPHGRRRVIPPQATVHESVLRRICVVDTIPQTA